MGSTVNKISVSLPDYIYEQLTAATGKREVSGYIAKAVEEKLLDDVVGEGVEAFLDLRRRLPKISARAIREAIAKGRV